MGIHGIGIDISAFNTLISNVKVSKVDYVRLYSETQRITFALKDYISQSNHIAFEQELSDFLTDYDKKYFPSPDFKVWVRKKEIDEKNYVIEHEKHVLEKFEALTLKYKIKLNKMAKIVF